MHLCNYACAVAVHVIHYVRICLYHIIIIITLLLFSTYAVMDGDMRRSFLSNDQFIFLIKALTPFDELALMCAHYSKQTQLQDENEM